MQFESRDQLQKIFDSQGINRWKVAGATAKERIAKLKRLRKAIVQRQDEFYEAVWQDFHKSRFEAWLCEIFPTIEEIDEAINHLGDWMRDKRASWVFFLPTTRSRLHYEPKGRVLVMAPWNYPFLLFVSPIVSAIAAGNTVIAKPSHKTPRVSAFLSSLFEDVFETNEVAVIEGAGARVGDELLNLPFDHVFFTGSPKVGAHVGEMSQRIHAGLTLELGGKSPAILLDDVDVMDAAKKLAWGKTLNAGQTCIAPDYLLCPKNLVIPFAEALAAEIKKMFGETDKSRKESDDFVHIIDSRAVERHQSLVEDALDKGAKLVLGGTFDVENCYSPVTILSGVTAEMSVMQSEIFGPIMPIVSYENLDEAIGFIQDRDKPLALYVFGKSNRKIQRVLSKTTSGSACVNNCIIQIENLTVPFGGVGNSGIGNYHGFFGFRTFSHERNIMVQKKWDVVSFFHAPFVKNVHACGLQATGVHGKIQSFFKAFLDIFKGMKKR